MNLLNSTLSVVLVNFLGIAGIVIAVLVASSVLRLFSRLFKFPQKDFKTALYCILIIVGISIGVSTGLIILFLDQIQKILAIFVFLPAGVSLAAGTYVVHKFYGSSVFKSFSALFLTGLFSYIVFVIFIILVGFILGPYLQ